MIDKVEEHLKEYIDFKNNIPAASSQMLRIMSKLEIEMISKDIMNILTKKYKIESLPDIEIISQILERTFENSIIRSDSELKNFLAAMQQDYNNMDHSQIIGAIDQEFEELSGMVKRIYSQDTTSCYADFTRRCTEEITRELRSLNATEEFEAISVKMKMQLKKELNKVLQKFLDGAYKTINTQILMKMQRQSEEVKALLK